MTHSITIPRLGWSMEEGVFGEWLKCPANMFAQVK
jgi:pyruvate/2-oxoglutarate dehydrogenase complex dihydrolipoamide acyltransferase (E2) component